MFIIQIVLGVEKEAFRGSIEEERCSFFVGVSRAKKYLMLTQVNERQYPEGSHCVWYVN